MKINTGMYFGHFMLGDLLVLEGKGVAWLLLSRLALVQRVFAARLASSDFAGCCARLLPPRLPILLMYLEIAFISRKA